jgi:hypothetical protein
LIHKQVKLGLKKRMARAGQERVKESFRRRYPGYRESSRRARMSKKRSPAEVRVISRLGRRRLLEWKREVEKTQI